MKRSSQLAAFVAMAGVVLFASCSKSNDSTPAAPVEAKAVANINSNSASTNGHFAFYSLERNEPVAYTDSATTKWDIAFRSTVIIINGGTSGPGNGGAFVQRGTTFADYKTISADSTFKLDATGGVYAITTGSDKGWYSYNPNTHIISPIAGNLLIVRTATGKYAKVEVTSYYQGAPAVPDANTAVSGYYNFRFGYQSNGSKQF